MRHRFRHSTKTGIALLRFGDGIGKSSLHETVKVQALTGLPRAAFIAKRIVDVVDEHKPDLAVLEGYGFKNKFTLSILVEVGTLVRYALLRRGIPVATMPPKSLKEWVTGNGNADKQAMLKSVENRWGFLTKDDNQADAFGLAMAGGAFLGAINCTSQERVVVNLLSFLPCFDDTISL